MKKREKLTPDFIQIPYQLIGDKSLAPIDRLVYGAVYFYSKMRGERCYASNTEIARLLLSTPNTVGNALKKLEDRRYIIRGFSDPNTKVNRTEIIPTVAMGRLTRTKSPSNDGVAPQKSSPLSDGPVPSNDGVKSIKPLTTKNGGKNAFEEENTAIIKDISDDTPSFGSTSNDGEIEKGIENIIENNDKDLTSEPPVQPNISSDSVEPIGSKVNDAIALFLPILPGDFVGKSSAFARPPTRKAVEALLKRYSLEQIKELIRKYDEGKSDQFRPQVGTVYEFCTIKLAKVEAFVEKKAGKLWANRSISTPEQSKTRDEQYQKIIDASEARSKKAKEDWLKDHPEENLE